MTGSKKLVEEIRPNPNDAQVTYGDGLILRYWVLVRW